MNDGPDAFIEASLHGKQKFNDSWKDPLLLLFSGRYKAVLVDKNDYLSSLTHYVHLNPVRAKLVTVQDGIENYPWCSLSDYMKLASKRRSWLAVGSGLEHLGYGTIF